jgi:hypothetical protein
MPLKGTADGLAFRRGHSLAGDREPGAKQAAGKLVRVVGQGFIPGTKAAESARASAPEVCFLPPLIQNRPFSAACKTLSHWARFQGHECPCSLRSHKQ